MKLKKVEIEGFRAYKYKNDGTFDFTNDGDIPANFVAIYAPNGFGKSSFYDAVEWAVTNHVDRLGGEYNRTNHDNAARSTKEKGVAQKIIRNIDIAQDFPTRVTVYTTLPKPFVRKLKNIRSNARDLQIGTIKKRENEYFRKVILSQDEIDRFLREAKPQDRYKRFMENFGGDAEIIRQELTVLISDNKTSISDLNKKRDKILEQLNEPIDVSVFERLNKTIIELNADGEKLPFVDKSFSAHTENEILSIFITRRRKLETQIKAQTKLHDLLIEQLLKLPEVQLNLNLIAEQQPKLTKLRKGVADAQRYQSLLISHSKCLGERKVVSEQLKNLVEINRLAKEFFQHKSEISVATEKQRALSNNLANEVSLLEDLEQLLKKKNEDLATADTRTLVLRDTLDNCDQIYSKIKMYQEKVAIVDSLNAKKDVSLSLDKTQKSTVERSLAKISSIKVTSQSLLMSDLSMINFDKLKLQELSDFSAELENWALYDESIQKTQSSLLEQMGLHERLITTGLQYLSAWPTSTCPLCHKSHDSESDLKKKVEGTDLLSSLSKENARKLEVSAKVQSDLNSKIDLIVQEVVEIQMKQLSELRIKLNELGGKISQTEKEKMVLIAEKKTLEARLKALLDSVLGLAKQELIYRAEVEFHDLTEKRSTYLSQKAKINQQVNVKRKLIFEQGTSIKALILQIKLITESSVYERVNTYLKANSLSSHELKIHCTEKIPELEKMEEKYREAISQLTEQCKALQNVMLTDGTWAERDALSSQKEEAEIQIAESKSFSEAFFESVNRTIGPQAHKPINEVKGNILKAIDEQNLQYHSFNSKLEKTELLSELLEASKPYLTSLSLREELEDVDINILQRNHVDIKLTTERDLIIDELKKLINAFFYEDLIDSIYKKIDPHPSFKKVEFRLDFETADYPGLNIVLSNGDGVPLSPMLYFSAAQLNVLSLSVFLASALHTKDDGGKPLDVIMIDDPIQSMDSINVLAMIDLLRSISVKFNKQIIISTHDENFFGLLQRKIPSDVLGSKFLKLEKFGVVVPVEPLVNE